MEAHKKGRDVMLAFKEDIGLALSKACDHDADADAIHLAMAANIVRREMFQKRNNFSGSFGPVSGRIHTNVTFGFGCYDNKWAKH